MASVSGDSHLMEEASPTLGTSHLLEESTTPRWAGAKTAVKQETAPCDWRAAQGQRPQQACSSQSPAQAGLMQVARKPGGSPLVLDPSLCPLLQSSLAHSR